MPSPPIRPHIFIASSSEQLRWARAFQDELDDDAEVTVWPQGVFRPSASDLTSLVAEAKRCDFAVFVFAPDDLTIMRNEEKRVTRDNVIFELGLFIGELGRERCFLVSPRGEELHLPTDLLGATPLKFDPDRRDGNCQAAVGRASNQIRAEVRARGARPQLPQDNALLEQAVASARLAAEAGLVGTFTNRGEAFDDILEAVSEGGCIRLLSNKGDDWLGDDGAASEALLSLRARGVRFELRTILLHVDSPWLKRDGLEYLKRSRSQVVAEFTAAHDLVEQWCAEHGCPPPRYHRHHPSWRFIQTDQALFISTYVINAQMTSAPVLKFSARSPIYRSVTRYFDFLYAYCSAPRFQLSAFERLHGKSLSLEASAGVVVTRGAGAVREAMLVRRPGGELALPKGHIEEGEDPPRAAIRELFEETGAALDQQRLSFLTIQPVAHVLPEELILKSILFYQAEGDADMRVDPERALWMPLAELESARFVEEYIRAMLEDLRQG